MNEHSLYPSTVCQDLGSCPRPPGRPCKGSSQVALWCPSSFLISPCCVWGGLPDHYTRKCDAPVKPQWQDGSKAVKQPRRLLARSLLLTHFVHM